MHMFFLVIFLLTSICLISLIMLQQSKSDISSSVGSITSTALLGSSSSGTFITHMTGILATIFFILSLILVNITTNKNKANNLKWENIGKPTTYLQNKNNSKIKINNDIPQ
ncbi:Protein-export membrane protein SecG [Candidatus Providencia siddallii]|uniref:Protein-export membrane protein SecG n=1 Tax=Candidatus Providencia siddallii TaxID=1715285 RepID=A0A0M6W706_9GAMM|nr:Protein-export membrane protein SecG [Candidatus Providencia siddallii]